MTGHGVGKPTRKGLASSWRYSLVMRTSSTKWARLNGLLAIGEWEVDEGERPRAGVGVEVGASERAQDLWISGEQFQQACDVEQSPDASVCVRNL